LLLLTSCGCRLGCLLLTGSGRRLRRLLLTSCGCRLCRLLLTSCGCRLRRLLLLTGRGSRLFLLRLAGLLLHVATLRPKPGTAIRGCLGAGWRCAGWERLRGLRGAARGSSTGQRLQRISRREMRLLLLTSCGCRLFLLRLTRLLLLLPFGVLRIKPSTAIPSCLGAGWRDDLRQCLPGLRGTA
jgi:hypothetical protein